jgi:hypothetical protein
MELPGAITGISLTTSEPARLFFDKMVLPCPLEVLTLPTGTNIGY